MEEIFDIHSHILPGLDDGSKSFDDSIRMLRDARSQGICSVIATPHLSPLFRKYDVEKAVYLLEELRDRTEKEKIDIRLYLGQEIFWCEDTFRVLQEGNFLTMEESSYVLLEFYPDEAFYEILRAVRETLILGYNPVIAHAERFSALSDLGRLKELKSMGALIQLNFGSISGAFFDSRARYCRTVLKKGLADFLGTDMHNPDSRKPKTAEAMKWMEGHLDRDYFAGIVRGNAERMIRNLRI